MFSNFVLYSNIVHFTKKLLKYQFDIKSLSKCYTDLPAYYVYYYVYVVIGNGFQLEGNLYVMWWRKKDKGFLRLNKKI